MSDSNSSAAHSCSLHLSVSTLHQQETQGGGADDSRTGLGTSHNGQHSYGTLKSQQFSNWLKRVSTIHTLAEGDTLQGLAVKYSISVSPLEVKVVRGCSYLDRCILGRWRGRGCVHRASQVHQL